MAPAPQWLIDRCTAARPARKENAGKRIVAEDETAVELARAWMKRQPGAEWGTIDDTKYKLAARCYDFGCEVDTVELLLTEWCERNNVPTLPERLRTIAVSASTSRENTIGARHPSASGFEPMEIEERPKPANQNNATSPEGAPSPTTKKQPFTITAKPFVLPDNPKLITPRRWLYDKHYIRKFLSTTAAPGGLGKSSLTLVEAVAMAAGKDLLGVLPNRGKQFRVLYWNGEDPLDEIERRVTAICQHYEITMDDLSDRLVLLSGRNTPLCVAHAGRNGFEIVTQVVEGLEQFIRENRIDVAIFDPLIALHKVPENDNTANKAVCDQLASIADKANCSIELVDHMRKGASGEQGERTADDTRGAGAKVDAYRVVRVLNRMTKEEALKAGVENHRRYFRADNDAKGNLVPPAERATWYHLASVNLDNGDEDNDADDVGVVTPWEWPDASKNLSHDNIRTIQKAIAAGKWRGDIRATEWAGHAVAQALGWNKDDKATKEKARGVLQKLIRDGFLRVMLGPDDRRKPKQFVVVGKQTEQFEAAPYDLNTTFDTAPLP